MMSFASGGEAWRGCQGYSLRAAGVSRTLWHRQIVLELSFAVEGLIVEGLLGDVVRKGSFDFLSASRATLAASSMEVAAFKVALSGAIAGMVFRCTNGGRQMLELADMWSD
jgi:hypothetical protein